MIDKTRIVDTVCERLKTLPVSHCLDLRTYKRNRSVMIAKLAEDGKIQLDYKTLASALSEEELMNFNEILSSFGHVGEGHSRSEEIKK